MRARSRQRAFVRTSRPWQLYAVVAILLFIAVSALPAGYSMIRDPSGVDLGFPPGTLQSALFPDYLVPGLFLFLVLGIGSLLGALFLLVRPNWQWMERVNPFRHERWQWTWALAIGCVLMVWIVVQMVSVTLFSMLQPMIFGFGAAIVALLFAPSMRRHLAR